MIYAGFINMARVFAIACIGRLHGIRRYDPDTYAEFDISELPPGEVV